MITRHAAAAHVFLILYGLTLPAAKPLHECLLCSSHSIILIRYFSYRHFVYSRNEE